MNDAIEQPHESQKAVRDGYRMAVRADTAAFQQQKNPQLGIFFENLERYFGHDAQFFLGPSSAGVDLESWTESIGRKVFRDRRSSAEEQLAWSHKQGGRREATMSLINAAVWQGTQIGLKDLPMKTWQS